ncbi:hypothetical protein KKF84_20225 [Myxococcota bacterium]|nr:hypothetical protein [Myxococcota bacterium]MBU1537653.1 hypothetical protein [Myxococcota bacterium]
MKLRSSGSSSSPSYPSGVLGVLLLGGSLASGMALSGCGAKEAEEAKLTPPHHCPAFGDRRSPPWNPVFPGTAGILPALFAFPSFRGDGLWILREQMAQFFGGSARTADWGLWE